MTNLKYIEERMEQGLHKLPSYMHSGIRLYLLRGILPGSFLTAVLENNLAAAASQADDANRELLFDYANFLYNHFPSDAWGSPEKIKAWCESIHVGEIEAEA